MWDTWWQIYSLNYVIFSYSYRATNHVIQDFEACKICKKLRCKHKGKTKGSYKKDTKKENEKKLEPEKKKTEKTRKSDTEIQGQYKCQKCIGSLSYESGLVN